MSVPSFTDLRAFARGALAGTPVGGGTPLPLGEGPVSVAAVLVDGDGRAVSQADLFAIVLEGTLAIDGRAVRSMVLPGGVAFDWRAAGARVVTMRCDKGAPGAAAPVPIDEAAALAPSGAPLADLLVGSTPSCRNHTDYRSECGEFLCGTWDSTPYHRLPMLYRHHELMHLTQGSVTFEDAAGHRATFAAGDVFIVARGATCSWESREPVKKVYAIWRPAS